MYQFNLYYLQPFFSFIKHNTTTKEINETCHNYLLYYFNTCFLWHICVQYVQFNKWEENTHSHNHHRTSLTLSCGSEVIWWNLPPSAQPLSSFFEISTPWLFSWYFFAFLYSFTIYNASLNNIIVCLEAPCVYSYVSAFFHVILIRSLKCVHFYHFIVH